jgi:hypothetical protein
MPHPGSITASQGQPPDEEKAGTTKGELLPIRAVAQQERPVLPAGGLRQESPWPSPAAAPAPQVWCRPGSISPR